MAILANIYPDNEINPAIHNSDNTKANLGFCFSGGGSRALTCAWGQMLGLKTLNLLNKARYISSVSGGTWASSIYHFLPDNIRDDDLFGAYHPPEELFLENGDNRFNVNNLDQYSLGQAPAGMGIDKLLEAAVIFLLFHSSSDYKWLWAFIVGKFILEPFGLRAEGKEKWSSSKYFSLSENYAENNFPSNAPDINDFFFLRSGRPFPIMNNNIMEKTEIKEKDSSNIVQLPNQVTPVSSGARGRTPDSAIIGGGSVESYGSNSTLDQSSANESPVNISISQAYSLIDIVSTSSAFFAAAIADLVKTNFQDSEKKEKLINKISENLNTEHKKNLITMAEKELLLNLSLPEFIETKLEKIIVNKLSLDNIIPTYNYWPVGKQSSNQEMGYTDGGTLDNTGVLGMLAQTDTEENNMEPISLVVFDNSSTPLKKAENGNIIAADQIAPLFGIDFNTEDGTYKPFTESQKDPGSSEFKAVSLITVFDNSPDSDNKTPFTSLVNGLYAACCGAGPGEKPDDEKVNTDPAFHQMELKTVQNSLANISAGRKVNLFYVQNSKILNWQNRIGDPSLKDEIAKGQKRSIGPFADFKNFPYYSTSFKIGLEAKESNTLSQMWAWAVCDDASPMKAALKKFGGHNT